MTDAPARASASRVVLAPLEDTSTFADRAYAALKDTIVSLNVYEQEGEVRLDERQLASDLGISRTPVREAMAQLEREGFVRSAWLITQNASTEEIAALRKMFATFENGEARAHLDEYSEANIEFHQTIIRMSKNHVLIDLAENLFTHMRMIRRKTIGEQDRVERSIRDHINIIEALEARDTDRAEDLVRNHALGLAEHVKKYADYLN
jgi:DNA-binding GntR family transcriptional regulator